MTSLSIPSGVVDIGDNAFSDGRSMTSVAIPKKFHDSHEAWRLGISHLWPDGFSLPNANQEPVDSGKLGDLFFAFAIRNKGVYIFEGLHIVLEDFVLRSHNCINPM